MAYSLWKRIRCFPSTLRWMNLKTCNTQRSFWICVWLKKARYGKLHDYRDAIVLEELYLFRPIEDKKLRFSFLRFERRLRRAPFRDGVMWTVGLIVEIKLRFQILRVSADAVLNKKAYKESEMIMMGNRRQTVPFWGLPLSWLRCFPWTDRTVTDRSKITHVYFKAIFSFLSERQYRHMK